MEKSAAVVADSLGITKGIDLMKDAGKVTGGMMKVPHRCLVRSQHISWAMQEVLLDGQGFSRLFDYSLIF
jgi:hypothetical protein